jgi:hypothetical protein
MHKDCRDVVLLAPSQQAVDRLDAIIERLARFRVDPLAEVDALIADHPDFALAHGLRGALMALSTEKPAMAELEREIAAMDASPMGERERMHLAGLKAWAQGDYHRMVDLYAEVSIRYPRDLMALFVLHQGDFLTGQSRLLRDHPARVLSSWGDAPGRSFVMGMHAFGLEEMGDYAAAEVQGLRALEADPLDAWAVHAVAHVMEMQGRSGEGIAFMAGREADWASDNFLAYHNWWHRALFHLDREEFDVVLDLYDRGVRPVQSAVALEMVDGSALLWRLRLRGVDVGDRWHPLAEAWAPMLGDANYPFNDVHAIMAMIGAGRLDDARRGVEALAAKVEGGSAAAMTREVGLPVGRALLAFAQGRDDDAVADLAPVIAGAHRYGGSHAQRDLLDLTLLAAAQRCDLPRARALLAERLALKPASLFNWRAEARVQAQLGNLAAAAQAEREAASRRRSFTAAA